MCRQHLRSFSDGARVRIQPFRASAFPVVRDFAVDRSARVISCLVRPNIHMLFF